MKLSICMMVKNESKYLENCLKSIQPILDAVESELIIIDTGSEDNTVEIASRYTDKIYFHEWNHNFSEMRNTTISYATGEWLFIIDADEVLQETQPIIDFLRSCINEKIGAATITGKNIIDEMEYVEYSVNSTPRLFKNDGYFHYEGTVHNQPVFKGMLSVIEASLLHYGYVSTDRELMKKKFLRTSTLLKKELEKNPENIYYLFQLSVTYGMYGDIERAIEYSEKAYELFKQQNDPKENRCVIAHRAHMYQLASNYPKVEEVCLEALAEKAGYLDIYYYLAEAEALMGKHEEAIYNYKKYLDLLEKRENIAENDITVIDYTVGNQQKAYFNLSLLVRKIGNDVLALQYAQKINRKDYICNNFPNIIDLFIRQGQYKELRNYYNIMLEEDCYTLFYEIVEQIKADFGHEIKIGIAEVFYDVNDHYGLLSSMILDHECGNYSPTTLGKIKELDFSDIPIYCSEILYYLMKMSYPLQTLLTKFKENWLTPLFNDFAKRHDDFSLIIFDYLCKYSLQSTAGEYKLSKTLCRYILIIDKQTDTIYQDVFARYVRDGISYMKIIYAQHIIENALVYEVKNDEEVFLLYMYHAQLNQKKDQVAYIKNLGLALKVMPQMKKGIERLLKNMQIEDENIKSEMDDYKTQVKTTIKQLITSGQIDDAKNLIEEYENIVGNDAEIYSMQSIIAIMEERSNDEKVIFEQDMEMNKKNLLQESEKAHSLIPLVESPLVTIGIINYNQEKYIEDCLQSIISQDYNNKEILIIDDCSTDTSMEIINKYMAMYTNIRLIQHKKNSGSGCKGVQDVQIQAQGEYFTFIDADDYYPNESVITDLVNAAIQDKHIDFVYGNFRVVNENGQKIDIWKYKDFTFEEVIEQCFKKMGSGVMPTMGLYKKDFYTRNNLTWYHEKKLRIGYDTINSLINLKHNIHYKYLDKECLCYRRHSNNITNDFPARINCTLKITEFIIKNFPETIYFPEISWHEIQDENLKKSAKMYSLGFYFYRAYKHYSSNHDMIQLDALLQPLELKINSYFKNSLKFHANFTENIKSCQLDLNILKNQLRFYTKKQKNTAIKTVEHLQEKCPELQKIQKLIFFVKEGYDGFIGDIIKGLSDEYEVKKVIITDLQQIDEGMEWADICWFEWYDELVIYGSKLGIAKKKYIVCRIHGYEIYSDIIMNANWRNIDQLIVVAPHILRLFKERMDKEKMINTKIDLALCGVDVELYPFKERKKGYNIGYLGLINFKKNIPLTLDIFYQMYLIDRRYKLYLAGEFQDERTMKYLQFFTKEYKLEENIFFDGWKDQEQKVEWLKKIDYMLISSIDEGLCYAAAEAMASGIKPVLHKCEGLKDHYTEEYLFATQQDAIRMIEDDFYDSKNYRKYIETELSCEKQITAIKKILNFKNLQKNKQEQINKYKEVITSEYVKEANDLFIPYSVLYVDNFNFKDGYTILIGKREKISEQLELVEFIIENSQNKKLLLMNIWYDTVTENITVPNYLKSKNNFIYIKKAIEKVMSTNAPFINNISGFVFDEVLANHIQDNEFDYDKEMTVPATKFMPAWQYLKIIERYIFAAKFIKTNDCVLEATCGFGYGTAYLSRRCNKIVALDLALNKIEFAKKTYDFDNIEWINSDVTKLPCADNIFNVYTSFETLQHLPLDLIDQYLQEAVRVLKKDGTMILSTPNTNYAFSEWDIILKKYFNNIKYFSVVNFAVEEGIRENAVNMVIVCSNTDSECSGKDDDYYNSIEENTIKSINKLPKVSVIILTYNEKEYLKQAIDSVLRQDYENIEIIVGDDASTDGTEEIMEFYQGNTRIKYHKNPINLGVKDNAHNILYNLATGEFAMFLDHDDYMINDNHISKAINLIIENPKVSFVFGNCKICNVDTNEITDVVNSMPTITNGIDYFLNYEKPGYCHIVSGIGCVFNRSRAIEMNTHTDETQALDLFLWLKLMLTGDVGFINEFAGVYRIHNKSLSFNMNISYDYSTIVELEKLKDIAISRGISSILMDQWIIFRVFKYVRWAFISHYTNDRQKIALDLLQSISNKYPEAFAAINTSFDMNN